MSKFWQKKYISKHTGAEIDEAVEAVRDGDVGTTVVANPTLAGTEAALEGLQVDETKYKVAAGMENPMTAAGDLIVGGTDGAPDKLVKGTDGKVLKMVSGAPAWGDDAGTTVVANPQLAGTEAALKSIKIDNTDYINKPEVLDYTTTAPAADNNNGIKIVVLSSEPATKYNGYLYIITA